MAVTITLNIILALLLILAAVQFITKSRYPIKHAVLIIFGLFIICYGIAFDNIGVSKSGIMDLNTKGVFVFLVGLCFIIYSMFNWQGKMSKTHGTNLKSHRYY